MSRTKRPRCPATKIGSWSGSSYSCELSPGHSGKHKDPENGAWETVTIDMEDDALEAYKRWYTGRLSGTATKREAFNEGWKAAKKGKT